MPSSVPPCGQSGTAALALRGSTVMAARTHLVVGATPVARRVAAQLAQHGHVVRRLEDPREDDLVALGHIDGVAILLHDDIEALRWALTATETFPDVPVVATVFDRTIGDELMRLAPQCHVRSPGDVAAPVLAASLLQNEHGRQRREQRLLNGLFTQLRAHDPGTSMLLVGLLGLLTVLAADFLYNFNHDRDAPQALFDAARVVATVGPADRTGTDGYLIVSALAMLSTLLFTALFTAGVVERMLSPRLVGILGSRTLPHRGHIIVVGLGQVGFRLCQELRTLKFPVVAVERNANASGIRLARAAGIPVVLADATDRELLQRVRIHRASGLAAVGSTDRENLAVAIAASAIAPDVTRVLRSGNTMPSPRRGHYSAWATSAT